MTHPFIKATLAGAFCGGMASTFLLTIFQEILHYSPTHALLTILGFACLGAGMFGISEEYLKKYEKKEERKI